MALPLARAYALCSVPPRVPSSARAAALARTLAAGASVARASGATRAAETAWRAASALLEPACVEPTHGDGDPCVVEIEDLCVVVEQAAKACVGDSFFVIAAEAAARAALLACRSRSSVDGALCARLVRSLITAARACGGAALDRIPLGEEEEGGGDFAGGGSNDNDNDNDDGQAAQGDNAISYNRLVGAAYIVAKHSPDACLAMIQEDVTLTAESRASRDLAGHCQLIMMFASRKKNKV